MKDIEKYSCGCESVDELIGGGFETGTVTQIYGEAGTGKTNICIQLAFECVKSGKKVIYIDTEGLSIERFKQIVGGSVEDIVKDVIMYEPLNFDQQSDAIEEVKKIVDENVGLILLDSATLPYRYELGEDRDMHARRDLANQISDLLEITREYNIGVVVTSHVYTDIKTNEIRPLGGHAFEHLSKTIIQLEKAGTGKRKAILRKHRSRPEGISCEFVLTGRGVESVQGGRFLGIFKRK